MAGKWRTFPKNFHKELLCLASWDIIKQSPSTRDGFLSSDALKRVMETIKNVDIGELGDASLPNTQALDRTPTESQRIEVLERELTFHRGKVRDIESSIVTASLETTPNTRDRMKVADGLCNASLTDRDDSLVSLTSLGPVNKKRQLKSGALICLCLIY